jgi:arsenate reductase (glutaredoxin)
MLSSACPRYRGRRHLAALLRHLARLDIPGGGRVATEGGHAFVGHMHPPEGTSIIDVEDPPIAHRQPGVAAGAHPFAQGAGARRHHAGQQRAVPCRGGGRAPGRFRGRHQGLRHRRPLEPAPDRALSGGSHRFDSDGRYAYISSEEDGFTGDIVVILDLADPTQREPIGKWWMPGQWEAGGETPYCSRPCVSARPRLRRWATSYEEGSAMPVRIYHNPRCNTSRKTLALLREKGIEPEIVEYLKTPYTAAGLKTLLGQLKMPARALLRRKEAAAAGIDPAKLSEDALIGAMVKNPIIVERPIVVSGGKAALGRPPEQVLTVL